MYNIEVEMLHNVQYFHYENRVWAYTVSNHIVLYFNLRMKHYRSWCA